MSKKLKQLIWLAAALVSASGPVLAENPNDFLRSRTYLGAVGTSIAIGKGGLFNGGVYARYDAPYEIDLIPALSQNFGFGLLVGHREDAYALEISYWESSHTASFGPASVSSAYVTAAVDFPLSQDSAVVRSVNLDFKRYFLTDLSVQPFLTLGVSFPWITVSNGAADVNGNVTTLSLAGLGLDLGIGVEYYLTPNISLLGGVTQRWASFDQFKGFAGQYNNLQLYGNAPSDDGSGLNFTLGTSFGFQ